MKRGIAGHFETTIAGSESVRAFVPDPLPPVPSVALTPARLRLLERALLACGRLDGVSALLPDPDLFLYAYVRREAVLSSQIEGIQSSLSDLLLFEMEEAPSVPLDDVVEVSNYVAAMEHGLSRLGDKNNRLPLSNRLLREIHGKLMARGRGAKKEPGEFRRSQNWIGGTRPGNARYVPPPPHGVADCMAALERFVHDPAIPTLIKAALAHIQFETIHPFLDGNGRTGRLLIALILHQEGVLRQPLLYLSLYLKQHRAEYYRLLDAVRQDGDWETWMDFMLEGMLQTAEGAVDTVHRLLALFAENERRIRETGRAAGSAQRAFAVLRRRPLVTIDDVANGARMTFPTASRAIDLLTELRIVRELKGKQRNRVFAYDSYLAILNEGTQP
jgi:Fic family protein